MKFLHTAFLLLLVTNLLQAQTLQLEPVKGNPLLRSVAAQKSLQDAKLVEQMTGYYPAPNETGNRFAVCPPTLEGNIVESGKAIEIELDTLGLMNGDEDATVTLENGSALLFGTAVFDDTLLFLTYASTAGLTGANTEVLQFKLSQPGHDTIFTVEIQVRRKGRVVVTQPQTVQPESITTFCLGNELDFDKPIACAASTDEVDGYDGRAYIVQHLRTYDFSDTCLVYYSSRFPGVDTISMTICDEWGVCDVFKVPYIIPGDTLSIALQPFFDDFSSYDGVYPTNELWLDNSVFRNTTLAKDPPSVGLVTFDGLNFRGDDYIIVEGIGDRLTSKAIDLSNYNASSNVSLRFFLAPKGYGLPPDITDEFTVEFRNSQREWVKVATFAGTGNVPSDSIPPFVFNGISVDDPQFLHEAFQFRFNAVTSPGGMIDLWHLDYVMLALNINSNVDFFDDITLTQLPNGLLSNYTSMPLKHLKANIDNEVTTLVKSNFVNLFDIPLTLAGQIPVSIIERNSGNVLTGQFQLVQGGSSVNLDPFVHKSFSQNIPTSNLTSLKNNIQSLDDNSIQVLETKYSFTPSSSQQLLFAPNNTVKSVNILSNYFAHDDGSAEWQAVFDSPSGIEQFASKFHTNEADTLKYVQIMFPHVNIDVSNQLFNLNIWIGQLDTMPEFSRPLLKPLFPSQVYDTLQGFTTYILDDFGGNAIPLGIPANTDFYVGIQQATAAPFGIPVGFDFQNPCNCNWLSYDTENWFPFPSSYQGALMIRPVFGETNPTSHASEVAAQIAEIALYPNPTSGELNIALKTGNYHDYELAIYNSFGQLVMQGALSQNVDLSAHANGIYFVNIINEKSGERVNSRIVLSKD